MILRMLEIQELYVWEADDKDWSQNAEGIKTVFSRLKRTLFPPQTWEENGGVSYSPNVAYLAYWGLGGGGAVVDQGFFPYFPPLKPRYILWSSVSYSLKNTVYSFWQRGQVERR